MTQLMLQKCFKPILLSVLSAVFLIAASPQPRRVLFLGDSITAGYGLEPEQAYPALIQQKIDANGLKFRVINAGQNGDTSAGGLNRLEWLMKSPVDVLVLELGGNDGLRGLPVSVTRKNLQAIVERAKARYPKVEIIVAGMKVPPNMGRDYERQFENIFTDLAVKNRLVLIPFVLEGVGGVRSLNFPDGVHPTAKGHTIVAAHVWKFLRPVLEKISKTP